MSKSVNVSALTKALRKIADQLPSTIDDGLERVAEIGATNAKSSKLYKDQTGELRQNTKFFKSGIGSRTIIADKFYSNYIEYGRGPVYAKKAKALRFVINGVVFFRKSVKASKPRPFMSAGRNLIAKVGNDYIARRMTKLFEKHGA
jgi:hypothetical protein